MTTTTPYDGKAQTPGPDANENLWQPPFVFQQEPKQPQVFLLARNNLQECV